MLAGVLSIAADFAFRFHERVALNADRQELEQKLDAQKHLVMRDDLRAMRRVLRRLEYLDDKNVVTVKGQAACEISSVDELILCELLFQNTFDRLAVSWGTSQTSRARCLERLPCGDVELPGI